MSTLYRSDGRPAPTMRPSRKKGIDNINRLPDEILQEIFNEIYDARQLCYLSMVSKRFASLIPNHSASTITLQLPRPHDLVSMKTFSRHKFIALFKKFISKFRFIHTLHIQLTRQFYNVNVFIEFTTVNKPPQIFILSALIPGEEYVYDHYRRIFPVWHNTPPSPLFPGYHNTPQPLDPGYDPCGRWGIPLMILLSDFMIGKSTTDSSPAKKMDPLMNDSILRRWYFRQWYFHRWHVPFLLLPKSASVKEKDVKLTDYGSIMEDVMLSVTRAGFDDDEDDDDWVGVFFSNNTRGKPVELLVVVKEIMENRRLILEITNE